MIMIRKMRKLKNQRCQEHLWHHHRELHMCHRYMWRFRPVAFLFNLLILYLLFNYIGIKAISIFLAALFVVKETVGLILIWRMEKRIFRPIVQLKSGVDQIARGNYSVRIDNNVTNEIGVLIRSFNDMAEKLQQSEKIKLEYEENRKALIANISHDLKTPITSISGYVGALIDDVVIAPDRRKNYLITIQNNISYINNLIDDLFLFTKLDMQRLHFHYEDIKIQPYMGDLIEEIKIELEEKGIVCNYNNKIANECYVRIDRKRIYQAIRNIIGNAVKYGPEKGLEIGVTLSGDNDNIYIEIQDNGPGIPEDKLPYVFDRFYRIDTERTKDLMSTGLGLAIAKELVEAHGGKISASSILNQGSCLAIMLPADKSKEMGQQYEEHLNN